jgi:hypothetical protein
MLLETKAGLRFCFERCNSCLLFSGQTALHWSSKQGHVEVCKLLVESEADVNVKEGRCDAAAGGQQPRAQAAVHYLMDLARSTSDNGVLQTAVLRALESIVTGNTANQAAAGPDAACFFLRLADSSSGSPTVQTAALHAFTAVVSRHKLNKEAAGPRAVQLLLPLLHSPGDNDSCAAVHRAALDALYAVVVNVPGNQSAAGARCGSHTFLRFVFVTI